MNRLNRIVADFRHDKNQGGDFWNTLWRKIIMTSHMKRYELWSLRKFYSKGRVLNIGAGRDKLGDNVISLDFTNTQDNWLGGIPNPDVVADMHHIPFPDETFDTIVATHILEHSKTPQQALFEMLRVIKNNGVICGILPNFYCGMPIWYYHRNPTHYQRFTDLDFRAWLSENGILQLTNLVQFRRMKKFLNPYSFDWVLMKKPI
jgi:SAM-dependent methyltransferase